MYSAIKIMNILLIIVKSNKKVRRKTMKRFSKISILFGVILFILCIGGCFRSRRYTLEEGEYFSVDSSFGHNSKKDDSLNNSGIENDSDIFYSKVKVQLCSINKQTYLNSNGVNVIYDAIEKTESLKYYSFSLHVYIDESDEFCKIDLAEFECVQFGDPHIPPYYVTHPIDETNNCDIDEVQFSYNTLQFRGWNIIIIKGEQSEVYNLSKYSSITEGEYISEIDENKVDKYPFSKLKLRIYNIDKQTYLDSNGINVFCDYTKGSNEQQYYSFELFLYVNELEDYLKINLPELEHIERCVQVYASSPVNSEDCFNIRSITFWYSRPYEVIIAQNNEHQSYDSYTYKITLNT